MDKLNDKNNDNDLFGFMGWLAEKYKSSPWGMTNLVLIVLLAFWVKGIDAEQERRTGPIDVIKKSMSLTADRGK